MEETEDIPWSRLVPEQPDATRPRSLLIAGAVVAAVIVGVGGARLLFGGAEPQTPPQWVLDASAAATTTTTTSTIAAPAPGVVVSEADLMALVPSADDLAEVRLRAELFVTDYFTVDPELSDPEAVRTALAIDAELPHDLEQTASSYVDFARSGGVEHLDAQSHAVDVVVRRVVRTAEGVMRLPAERVIVLVGYDAEGTVVLDLPGLATIPVDLVQEQGGVDRLVADYVDDAGMTWPMAWRVSG